MLKGYYFITDAKMSRAGNMSDVKSALAAGVKVIQYRNKISCTKLMYEEAARLKAICKGAFFIVNDRLDIALSINADGVHLGRDDMPFKKARELLGKNKIIGLTVNSLAQAKEAQKLGADYIGLAPIFATGTKIDAGPAVGVLELKKIKRQVSIPLIAVGGISLANARDVICAGADGLCAISAVITKPDVKKEIEKFQALYQGNRCYCKKRAKSGKG